MRNARRNTEWNAPRRPAALLVIAMVALLVVSLIGGGMIHALLQSHRQTGRYTDELQAAWLAESGLDRALARLQADDAYRGETWQAAIAAPNKQTDQPANETTDETADKAQAAETTAVEIKVEETAAGRRITVAVAYPEPSTQRVLVERELLLPNSPQEPAP